MAYVAATASGNHVGGICVWRKDGNVTNWAYFYENIPIEYQSAQDTEDHEMRGMAAAVKTWAPLWDDHHVVLRSHHQAIKGSPHPTRRALGILLEKLSANHFTYELEWRLKRTDLMVRISHCLSRLHRDFQHWMHAFRDRVDELLGKQDWFVVGDKHRTVIPEEAFHVTPPDDAPPLIFDSMPPMDPLD